MGFVTYSEDIPGDGDPAVTIEHNLGSTDLLVQVWQNNHSVVPSVMIVDENSVAVYGILGKGRVVIGAESKEDV